MKTLNRLTLGTLLLVSATAQADFYIGAGAYSAQLEDVKNLDVNEDDIAPAVFLGWRPLELVGVELGYYDLGSYEKDVPVYGKASLDAEAITLAGLLSAEFGPAGLYAKLGVAQGNFDAGGALDGYKIDDSTDVFGGVGATVDIMDKLYIYAEYLVFTGGDVDINVAGAGLRYAF